MPLTLTLGSNTHHGIAVCCMAWAGCFLLGWVVLSTTCGTASLRGHPLTSRSPDPGLRSTAPEGHRARHSTTSVLILSDTHIAGPEYELNSESNAMDNVSVLRAMQRLYHALQHQHDPPLVFVLGDIVHDGLRVLKNPQDPESFREDLFDQEINGYTIAADLLQSLSTSSISYVFGNHDARVTCGDASSSITNKTLLAGVYEYYFRTEPYGVQDDPNSDWSFVRLNSMFGETWDATSPRCNTELASFGREQLEWLDGVLRERQRRGRHVLVLTHFPLTTVVEDEEGTSRSLKGLLHEYSSTVKGVLTGHFHKGIDWGRSRETSGVPVITVPAIRYSSNNFFRLDLSNDGTWSLHDFDRKNKHGARCSRGGKKSSDHGDCGTPLVGDEEHAVIEPVMTIGEFPDPSEFNPEGSCRWELVVPFFASCFVDETGGRDGSSMTTTMNMKMEGGADVDTLRDCCRVLESAFWPGSSHPFSTCLCMESFWEKVVELVFAGREERLIDLLEHCDRRGDIFLLWPRERARGQIGEGGAPSPTSNSTRKTLC